MLEYKIPDSIKLVITKRFLLCFLDELKSVFGENIIKLTYCRENYDVGDYDICSTAGWSDAFKSACKKCNMDWVHYYRNGMSCDDSDLFDGEIEELLFELNMDESNNN